MNGELLRTTEVPALLGGEPVRTTPLPVAYDGSGRIFGPEEEDAVRDVLRRGTLTRWGGTAVDDLERAWAERLGVPHALAVSSGTAALHVALAALDLAPGSEVVTTPVTDMGTVIAILQANLVPVFADVSPETGMLTCETVAAAMTARTGAILPVHLFGRCADTAALRQLADEHGVFLVEDASQAHFSFDREGYAGTHGHLSCFSLQQSKVVSCGEGGIVVAEGRFHERAELIQNKGWLRGRQGNRAYPVVGLNYRMPELSAAVALCQLRRATEIIARRRRSYAVVVEALRDEPGPVITAERPGERASWWALCVRWPELADEPELAAAVEKSLRADGVPFSPGYIGTSPLYLSAALQRRGTEGRHGLPWTLHPEPPVYRRGDCPHAERFLKESFVMNWNEGITPDDAADIARALARALPAARAFTASARPAGTRR
ncbi:DegT/DnrJ/EryC1/StrS family aminotransferase [Streptomyces sp. NPDC101234]|uniref:DegT/DnrJ/EryC1/StrS family aminotransferase n=1 Tax=Streptomyces sp. NPDC101234 TaxID=3366138 RepID=UPI00383087B6